MEIYTIRPDASMEFFSLGPAGADRILARKKQERGMLTQFRKYREQAKSAAKLGEAAEPREPKRTGAEAVVHGIDLLANKIGDLNIRFNGPFLSASWTF
jgi:hypothetical protein